MLPALEPGDRLLVRRARALHPGDIVVVREPDELALLAIKRVATVDERGVTVLGDNPEPSRDSRSYGPVPPSSVLGRAFWRYFPPACAGRLGPSSPTLSRAARGAWGRVAPLR